MENIALWIHFSGIGLLLVSTYLIPLGAIAASIGLVFNPCSHVRLATFNGAPVGVILLQYRL